MGNEQLDQCSNRVVIDQIVTAAASSHWINNQMRNGVLRQNRRDLFYRFGGWKHTGLDCGDLEIGKQRFKLALDHFAWLVMNCRYTAGVLDRQAGHNSKT